MNRHRDRSPRVLWVTNDLPPRHGGIESFIGELLTRTFLGSTHVLGPPDANATTFDTAQPYTVHRHQTKVLPSPALLRAIVREAKMHHADVIVLGALWPLGHLAGRIKQQLNIPIVALSHGHEAGLVSVKAHALIRHATRHVDVLTTISEYTQQRLARANRARHTLRVPPGVDTARFVPADTPRPAVLQPIAPDAPIVGALSRMVPRKGFDRLLAAWPTILAAHPQAWLVIAGDGPDHKRLIRLTRKHGCRHVLFVGAPASEILPDMYRSFDVFAQPVRTRNLGLDVEGLGIVFLEAQASGVPLVVGNSGGAPETLRSDVYGTVVDGRDTTAIARAITSWLDDPAVRTQAAFAARNAAEQEFSWPIIAKRFTQAVHTAITPASCDSTSR